MDEMQRLEKALASLNVSDEMLAEYLEKRKQDKPTPEKKVDSVWLPLSVVYINGPEITISSYLDLTKKDYLWGIMVSDICLYKNCAENVTMKGALMIDYTSLLGGRKAKIPNLSQMIEIFRYKEEFELTVKILKRYGISADALGDDWFWVFFTDGSLCLCKNDLTLKENIEGKVGSVRCFFNIF